MALAFPPPSAAIAQGISLPPGLEAPVFSTPPGLEKPRPRPAALEPEDSAVPVLAYGPRGSPQKCVSLPPAAALASPEEDSAAAVLSYGPRGSPQKRVSLPRAALDSSSLPEEEDSAVAVLSYGPRGSPKKRVSLPLGALQQPAQQKPVFAYGPPKAMTSPRKRGLVLGYGPRGTPKSYFPRSPKKQPVLAYGPNGSPKKRGNPAFACARMPRSPKKKAIPVYSPLQSSCLPHEVHQDDSISALTPAYVTPCAELSGDETTTEASQSRDCLDWNSQAEHLPAVIQPKVVTTAVFGQFEDPTVAPTLSCTDHLVLAASPNAMPR